MSLVMVTPTYLLIKKKQLIPTSYQLHCHTLETEDVSKYVGVTITNDISWDRHINNIVGKGNQTLGFEGT
jgi:hypothetical protein